MNRTRNIVRLFLASPADVSHERVIAESVVAEINAGIAAKLGLLIELVRWEDMIPGMGRPQQVILDQADMEETDIFVGILWNRFGTPTGRADSGTEEEFELAYQAWEELGRPRIMFYFCERPANFRTQAEIAQKAQVIEFRQRISSLGLIREFQEPREFEMVLRQDVTSHLLDTTGLRLEVQRAAERSSPRWPRDDLPLRWSDRARLLSRTDVRDMVHVPKGKFLAGRTGSEATVEDDYLIDLTPVTNCQFVAFVEQTGYMAAPHDPRVVAVLEELRSEAHHSPDHPVVLVTWFDAVAYAAWCGKRLPTALEWERAARGTDGRAFPWGKDFGPERCNCLTSGIGRTSPVLRYEDGRSPCGCYDMAGNVFEWTNDWTTRPRFSSAPNSEKINRGGSFNRPDADLVSWYSESDPPGLRMLDVGFRCAVSLEERSA